MVNPEEQAPEELLEEEPPPRRTRIIPHLVVPDAVWKTVVCIIPLCNMNTDVALDWIMRRRR